MSYAGDITPTECWASLAEMPEAQLVDVRTMAEWSYTGFPALEEIGKETLLVEWQQFPTMQVNSNFVQSVTTMLQDRSIAQSAPIYTLCRSGVRSIAAAQALTSAGFEKVYNVLDGFEGPLDENAQRGNVSGWKQCGLPWKQG